MNVKDQPFRATNVPLRMANYGHNVAQQTILHTNTAPPAELAPAHAPATPPCPGSRLGAPHARTSNPTFTRLKKRNQFLKSPRCCVA
jgi:hypothetical protein